MAVIIAFWHSDVKSASDLDGQAKTSMLPYPGNTMLNRQEFFQPKQSEHRRLNSPAKILEYLATTCGTIEEELSPAVSLTQKQTILATLGQPQNAHPTIHIAGTSGKGSVAYYIDAMLRAHNKRTSLMVSPHVYDLRERIQLNGQLMPEKHFVRAMHQFLQQLQPLFDIRQMKFPVLMTLFGFFAAASKSLDYLVLESGIGGKYDTTNTITRPDSYAVLTQIGLDHQNLLGGSLAQIAEQKAGILRPHMLVTALNQQTSVNTVFRSEVQRLEARPQWIDHTTNYQVDNLLLALNTVQRLAERDGWQFDEERAKLAARAVYIPGRFEKRSFKDQIIILDGAHNPQKLTALAWRLEHEGFSHCSLIFAPGYKTQLDARLRALLPITKQLICTEISPGFTKHRRAILPARMQAVVAEARKLGFNNVSPASSPLQALNMALGRDNPIVVTGSFHLLGEVDRLL